MPGNIWKQQNATMRPDTHVLFNTALQNSVLPTSTATKHLKKHGLFLDQKQAQLGTDCGLQKCIKFPRKEQQAIFKNVLCLWIVDACMPFYIIENRHFDKSVNCFDDQLSIPSRMTVSRHMKSVEEDMWIKVMDKLRSAPELVSTTTDACSSSIYKGHWSVTVQGISLAWELKSTVLDCFRFLHRILPVQLHHICMKSWRNGDF